MSHGHRRGSGGFGGSWSGADTALVLIGIGATILLILGGAWILSR
jgi:hypothetical protein